MWDYLLTLEAYQIDYQIDLNMIGGNLDFNHDNIKFIVHVDNNRVN